MELKNEILVQEFSNFKEGLLRMADVNPLLGQALVYYSGFFPQNESEATVALAYNAANNRPTGDHHARGQCSLEVAPFKVVYRIRGGFVFGWRTIPTGGLCPSFNYKFFMGTAHKVADWEVSVWDNDRRSDNRSIKYI